MKIVVRSQDPEGLESLVAMLGSENVERLPQQGLEGASLCCILQVGMKVLEVSANVATIAAFIHQILQSHDGKAVVAGRTVEQDSTPEEVAQILQDAAEQEKDSQKAE